MAKVVIIVIVFIVIAVWWMFFRVARSAVPPLTIDENDPLMLEATQQAKSSLKQFLELYRQRPQHASVKVPLTTSGGKTEFLWAAVLGLEGKNVKVRLLTQPVNHTGKLERLHTYDIQYVVDWSVEMEGGKIHGGYTMRVMFKKGREQWGDLPDELKKEEQKYLP